MTFSKKKNKEKMKNFLSPKNIFVPDFFFLLQIICNVEKIDFGGGSKFEKGEGRGMGRGLVWRSGHRIQIILVIFGQWRYLLVSLIYINHLKLYRKYILGYEKMEIFPPKGPMKIKINLINGKEKNNFFRFFLL